MARIIAPLFLIISGSIFLILSFSIAKAKIGDPYGPKYFPVVLGIFLVIMSVIYFVQEWKKRDKPMNEFKAVFTGRTPKLIGATIILIFIYAFLFERIGFLYSTIIFLAGLLFVVNGKKQWLLNIVVAVVFSFVFWYSFSELLKVSLP